MTIKVLVSRCGNHYALRCMSLTSTIHGLWYVQIALQVILSSVVIGRKAWRELPAFSAYILFATSASLVKYAVSPSHSGIAYFWVYWICEAVAIVLGLVVVREIFMKLFAPHLALRKLATLIFRVAIIMLIAFGCAVSYVQAPGAQLQGWMNSVMIGEQATRIVEVGHDHVFVFVVKCVWIALATKCFRNCARAGHGYRSRTSQYFCGPCSSRVVNVRAIFVYPASGF